MTPPIPVLGVSILIVRDGDILLVRRRRPPWSGRWALPGGRVTYRETLGDAAHRELLEETGVSVNGLQFLDTAEIIDPDGAEGHFVLVVFRGDYLSGKPVAGDDAAEARWVGLAECRSLPLAEQTRAIIDRHAGAPH